MSCRFCVIAPDISQSAQSHHSRRNPSDLSCWFLCCPGLHPRLHPQDQPDYSWALTPGCHLSCSPWSAVTVAAGNPPPSQQRCVNMRVCARNTKYLLLRLTRASWLHAKGTSLQKQVYRGRTVLYMVRITRGSLFPSSWPLCLCVAFPHPLRVALRKATCDTCLYSKFFFLHCRIKWEQRKDIYYSYEQHKEIIIWLNWYLIIYSRCHWN